jgi:hypothetical protein
VDGDFDGRYNRTPERSYHWLAVDLNHDGKYDYEDEFSCLARFVGVKDTYYSVELAPRMAALRMEKMTTPCGTLDVGCPCLKLQFFSDICVRPITRAPGKWEIPVGKYPSAHYKLVAKDKTGAEWTLPGARSAERLNDLEIRAGETRTVKMGPPLSVKTDVQKRWRTATIGLSIVGQGGELYVPRAYGNWALQPAQLKILDEKAKVLSSGQFEYG